MDKPDHRYLPPHAIWFNTSPKFKSCVSVVNNMYRYQVFNKVTGEQLTVGNARTLPNAKKHVFKYLKGKEGN